MNELFSNGLNQIKVSVFNTKEIVDFLKLNNFQFISYKSPKNILNFLKNKQEDGTNGTIYFFYDDLIEYAIKDVDIFHTTSRKQKFYRYLSTFKFPIILINLKFSSGRISCDYSSSVIYSYEDGKLTVNKSMDRNVGDVLDIKTLSRKIKLSKI